MPSGSASYPRRPQGFALLIVLWFLVLLAATGGWILSTSRSETSLAHNVMAAASAEALADAGVAQAVFHLTAPQLDERWAADGEIHKVVTQKGEILFRIEDEAGKINPNLASDRLLTALFTILGVDPSVASQLGTGIIDWVSKEDDARAKVGRSDQHQEVSSGDHQPPHAPVTDIDSLTQIAGMTSDIFAQVRPYFTIYTNNSRPEGNLISPVVKKAIEMAATNRPQMRPEEEVGKIPDTGMSAGSYRGQVAKPERDAAAQESKAIVTLHIIARGKTGGIYVRDAALRTDTTSSKGYVVLDWKRSKTTN